MTPNKIVRAAFSIALLSTFGGFAGSRQYAKANVADEYTFKCVSKQGTPVTLATSTSFEDEMDRVFIRWVSDLGAPVYTPKRRCEEVSNRMNDAIKEGFSYLTHGVVNGENVICYTNKKGVGCGKLFYTLSPDVDPKERLEDIFTLNERNFAGRDLREAPCSTYVSIDDILEGKDQFAEELCSAPASESQRFPG